MTDAQNTKTFSYSRGILALQAIQAARQAPRIRPASWPPRLGPVQKVEK